MSKAEDLRRAQLVRLLQEQAQERSEQHDDPSGIQPTPFDKVYGKVAGKSANFINGTEESVSNESLFNTDWVIKFRPSSDALRVITDGAQLFGFTGVCVVNYDGEQSLEYQASANPSAQPLQLPVVGKCFQVHGRVINWKINRTAPGSNPLLPLGIEWAIVPGRLSSWFFTQDGEVNLGTDSLFPIPVFAQRFQIFVNTLLGDTIHQVAPDGLTSIQSVPAGNNANFLQPIHPGAAYIRYSTTVPLTPRKTVVGFEIIS